VSGDLVREAVRGDERAPVRLRVTAEHPWRLEADGPTGELQAEGDDLFAALNGLREQLERDGWRLAVQGARADTYPSGMARGAGGRRVYVLRPGRHATRDDLVDTLAPLEDGRPGTVAEQRANFERWSADPDRT
jgi:hypothetical protein